MSKKELFLKLACPNKLGVSRWVNVDKFRGKFTKLRLGNGGSWCRKESSLAKIYVVELDKKRTNGSRIDRIRLNGFSIETYNQGIRKDIFNKIKRERCVVLGTSKVEVDHKNGRKNDPRVKDLNRQEVTDFQALSKAANDAKRQFCKDCKKEGKRFDAKRLYYNISFIYGSRKYNARIGCRGCYWHDPKEFKSKLLKK